MILIIKYFGVIADIIGKKEEQFLIDAGMNTVFQLRLKLERQYPEIKEVSYVISVNRNVAKPNDIVNKNDELAILPPFAGG